MPPVHNLRVYLSRLSLCDSEGDYIMAAQGRSARVPSWVPLFNRIARPLLRQPAFL